MSELARQLRGLQHGDHSCLFYETRDEQRAAMVPFFVEGMQRGERCLWLTEGASDAKAILFEAGIDLAEQERRGAFSFLTKRETYIEHGTFDPHAMMRTLATTIEESVAAGFTGLRGSGEMAWALAGDPGSDRSLEYESVLNDFVPGKPFVCICQYDKRAFEPGTVMDVLRAHPYAVFGELVCPNLYFEPNDLLFGRPTDEVRLAWRILQLRRARESALALEQAVAAREAFLAVASHELKTPLTALKLQLDLLVETGDLGPRERRGVQGAYRQTERLQELTDRLLDVTQLRARGVTLSRTEFDLAPTVEDVVTRLAPLAEKAGCRVDLALDAVQGQWDRARVEQIVSNLLANAFKFGAGRPVHVSLTQQGHQAVLTVRDEGIGIATADQTRVFGPFERAVSEDHYSGFGIGLWVVHQIAEAHGGTVTVDSARGMGATFTVRLPRAGTGGDAS